MAESRIFDGSSWITITDEEHRNASDPHTQYALADGTRGSFAAPLGADDNYVTDAEKAALHAHSNKAALDLVSGENTGDQVLPTWSTISGKPAVVAEGATQADARTAIGAGTSSFSGAYADLSGKPTLGDAAAKNTGTTAGTVAAGDDSRIGKIGGTVTVSGTPTAGQVPIASSGTAAAWGTPSGGGGGSNWSYVPTIPYVGRWYTSSSAGLSNNRGIPAEATLVPFLCPVNFTADRIAIAVSTVDATTNVRLGIYNSRTDGMPGTVLLDAGTVGVATVGEQSIVISQALTKGTLYWLVATSTVNGGPARGYGVSTNANYGGSPDLGRSSLTSGYAADGVYLPRSGGVGDGAALIDLTSRNDYVFAGGYTTPFLRVGSV